MNKVNISDIANKIQFIYGDECEKNTVGMVIFSDGTDYFFDAEYKNKMTNEEVEALLLRGAAVFKDGKYYKPASFDDENVNYAGKGHSVLFVAHGHDHYDYLDIDNDIAYFASICDATYKDDDSVPTREGVNLQSFEVITINKKDHIVNLTKIGAGEDRSFPIIKH